jgi:hypothetical protein
LSVVPDPQQLSLADEITDELDWGTWFRSLPIDPDGEHSDPSALTAPAEGLRWPEKRAA